MRLSTATAEQHANNVQQAVLTLNNCLIAAAAVGLITETAVKVYKFDPELHKLDEGETIEVELLLVKICRPVSVDVPVYCLETVTGE